MEKFWGVFRAFPLEGDGEDEKEEEEEEEEAAGSELRNKDLGSKSRSHPFVAVCPRENYITS